MAGKLTSRGTEGVDLEGKREAWCPKAGGEAFLRKAATAVAAVQGVSGVRMGRAFWAKAMKGLQPGYRSLPHLKVGVNERKRKVKTRLGVLGLRLRCGMS
jgi:hypothetical protein